MKTLLPCLKALLCFDESSDRFSRRYLVLVAFFTVLSSSSGIAQIPGADLIPPITVTKNLTIPLNAAGNATITATQINNGSSDNVGIVSYSLDKASFNCSNIAGISTAGNAALFTGGYIDVPNKASITQMDNWTIETWFNSSSTAALRQSLIENYDAGDNYGYLLRITGDKRIYAGVVTNGNNTGGLYATGGTAIAPNTWYHVAATFNRSTGALKVYVNGVLDGSNINKNIVSIPTVASLKIGARGSDAGDFKMLGMMDEVRIWSVERSQAEIKSTMAKSLSGSETGLQVYFPFTGLITTSVEDVTPLTPANTGTIKGLVVMAPSTAPVGGTTPVTLTATDAAGNSSTRTAYITVEDRTAPVIATNGDKNVNNNLNACSALVPVSATANDNCGVGAPTGVRSDGLALSAAYPIGTTTIAWSVTDVNGNKASAVTQTIIVTDNQAPVIATNGEKSVNNDLNSCGALVSVSATATDNCTVGAPTGVRSDGLPLSAAYPIGTTTITWKVADVNGVEALPVTQTVMVNDITPPVKPVLADISGECSATATAPITTDNCSGTVTGTTADPLTYKIQGTHVIHWSFNDGNGNVVTADQNVIVKDITKPVVPTLADVTGECSAAATPPTTTDNCSGTIAGTTTDRLTYTKQGTYVIHWSFNDGNGNVVTADQNVIVKDVTKPVVPTLADVTGECSAAATAPTTTDNCSGIITGTTSDPLTYTKQGTYVIRWNFNDGNGNVATANQNVVVKDVTKPTLPILADVTGECSATTTAPTTTDNCSGIITGTTSDPFTYTKQGTYLIHWNFNDGNGNVTTANQNVIVKDVTAPIVPTLATITGECSATATAPITTDNCVGTITGTTTDPLIYKTQGSYVIHWSFDDGSGNVSTANQNVIVKDVTAPAIPTLSAISGECSATATAPTTWDNCSGTITGTTTDPLTYSTQGYYVIHWSFEDAAGNVSYANQNVIVKDVTAPLALAKNKTITLTYGQTALSPADIDNGSYDACVGIASREIIGLPLTLDCSSIGTYPVKLKVNDKNGNTSYASATVTILGIVPSVSISVSRTDNTLTGLDSKTIALGYGAQNLILTATSSNATGNTYLWSAGAGTSNTTALSSTIIANPVFSPVSAGTYTYNVMVTNQYGCKASATVTLTVLDVRCGNKNDKVLVCLPTGSSSNPYVQICIDEHAVDVQLAKGGTLGTCNNGVSNNLFVGTSSTDMLSTNRLTTISNLNILTAYPNPFAKQTTVSFTLIQDEAKVSLDMFALNGVKIKNVYSGPANAFKEQSFNFNSDSLPAGEYFFRLTGSKANLAFKVILAH